MPSKEMSSAHTGNELARLLETALTALRQNRVAINQEIVAYPAPIPACDLQFNGLLEQRRRLSRALRNADAFLARGGIQASTAEERQILVEAVRQIDAGLATRLKAAFVDSPQPGLSAR